MTTPVWTRYVAIGDSFTEGMSDPDPVTTGAYVGWADRLAVHLDAVAEEAHVPFAYANLAVRGRKLDDVVGPQLDSALSLSPDLVSMVGGGNDLLRPSVDLDSLASRIEDAVVRLRRAGADVLLATPADPHSANIFTIAQRHDCFVLNLWGIAALRDWRMWGEDRIHLSSEGHRRVALAALTALGHGTDVAGWATPLAPATRGARRDEFREHAQWAKTHAAPWVQRRLRGESSGDRLAAKRPTLTSLRDPELEAAHGSMPEG